MIPDTDIRPEKAKQPQQQKEGFELPGWVFALKFVFILYMMHKYVGWPF